ncbi:hypothetical protein A3Q56_04441 [Intoshia linei]|uniref:Importin subunit alpha n=1 Tax=Intoshia linei TaxID=1819745 RepID=A0A177B2K4_9BILA|nr:hypothetical protein A3Q56_04441 [Intoshia linei]
MKLYIDSTKLKLERIETVVQLRKKNRNEMIDKIRNIDSTFDDNGEIDMAVTSNASLSPELIKGLWNPDINVVKRKVFMLRKLLCVENPPIEDAINANILPRLNELLNCDMEEIRFHIAWILTNIACGFDEHIGAIVNSNCLDSLIKILKSQQDSQRVLKQTVWTLSNIAGENVRYRNLLINYDIITSLISLVDKTTTHIDVKIQAIWCLSNMCRRKDSPTPIKEIKQILNLAAKLIYSDNEHILRNSLWILAYICDGPCERMTLVLESGILDRLIEIVLHPNQELINPALRTIGNILAGSEKQTQLAIDASVLPVLINIAGAKHISKFIRKEAFWALSNIAAGNPSQIKQLIDDGGLKVVKSVFEEDNMQLQKEGLWSLCNMLGNAEGTYDIAESIVSQGLLECMIRLLKKNDFKIVDKTLDCLYKIFNLGEEKQPNFFTYAFEELDGMDVLFELQYKQSDVLFKKSQRIIINFFHSDDDTSD